MPAIARSPAADDDDIVEAATHIARDNLAASTRWIDLIDEKLRLLAEFPGIGARRDEIASSLRSLPVGNYLAFYREAAEGIKVVRVLHGARNLRAIFRRL